ncbi:hypothetical protein ONZ45_g12140 [Pleurotus djamor]|nr:hypothetical protein ONZ45_g12140 [Pleurotus djamor]
MYPKLIALDTEQWGRGFGAFPNVEDNIVKINYWEIGDRSNFMNRCGLYPEIPGIIADILKNGAKLAIVSRKSNKSLCDRAFSQWTISGANEEQTTLLNVVEFDENFNACKTTHLENIHNRSHIDYSDMVLYDDDATSNIVEMMLGATFQIINGMQGLTWERYQYGIATWQRNQGIRCPYPGLDLSLYPKRKLLGYSGMDMETIQLLEGGGRRHDRKEAARWGYAMYVADDPAIAKYFSDWIKRTAFGLEAKTTVCRIYARDGEVFDQMQKIWVPNDEPLQTDVTNWDASRIAWSQENRDNIAARWGVYKPYVLFARHPNMNEASFPVKSNGRWNEMVIYPQIQESLIVTERMTDSQLSEAIQNPGHHLHYESKIAAWNITTPIETWRDFYFHRENFSR